MVDTVLNPTTPVTNGAIVTSSNPLPVTVVGAITATNITVGTTTITGGTASGILWKNAGVLAAGPATTNSSGALTLGNGASINFGASSDGILGATSGAFLFRADGSHGAIINVATDGTLKFFARDGSTPAAVQLGTLSSSAPAGSSSGVWKFGALQTAAVVLDTTRSIFVDIGGVVYKLMVAQ